MELCSRENNALPSPPPTHIFLAHAPTSPQNAGLLEVLLRFTIMSESGRRHPDSKNLRLTQSAEDFEFHKLALTLAIKVGRE